MSVNYKKLFHQLIERNISAQQLQKQCQISGNILTRLRRNEYVSLQTLEIICNILECRIDDILDFEK